MTAATAEILIYLIQTALSLYLLLVLVRFLLQLARADFYNPISQFIVKATNPVLRPLRKVIPGYAGLDVASLLLAVILQLLGIYAMLGLIGMDMPPITLVLLWSVLGVVALLLNIYFFALLGMIIISWIAPGSQNPVVYLLFQITEPVMAPFRKVLPPMGGLDFSPILMFVLINVIQIALRHMAAGVGMPTALVIGI